jgi:hypothetical protein
MNIEEEPGKFEIKETMKGSFYGLICCLVFCVILLVIVSIAIPSMMGSSSSPFAGFGTIILVGFWIVMVGLMIYIGLKMRGGGKERRFAMDGKKITFDTPNKPTFTINTSDFNTIEVSRTTRKDVLDEAMWYVNASLSSNTVFYKFHFLEATKSFILASQRDYSKKALKKIRAALEQFCQENGKTYIFNK